MTTIFLDFDEVLLNTTAHILAYHKLPNPYNDPQNRGRRDPHTMLGIEWKNFWFNLPIEVWATIPKYPWADDLVEWVKLKSGDVYFMSSTVRDGTSGSGKQLWLNNHYPELRDNLVLAANKSMLVNPNNQFLIDDSPKHEAKFAVENKSDAFYLFPSFGNNKYERYYEYLNNPQLVIEDLEKHGS